MATSLSKLVTTISTNVSTIDDYLGRNDVPSPSFDLDGPLDIESLPVKIDNARKAALDCLLELEDLLQGSVACMLPKYNATSLQAIYRFDIAKKVPLAGMISFAELGELCGLHTHDLRRIIRFAIAFHRLFTEPKPGFVAHSQGSRRLVADETIHAGLGQSFNEFFPSFARTIDALETFGSHEPHETGFALAHGTNQTLFDYLRSHPTKADQFSKAMVFYTRSVPGYSESYLIQDYPWHELRTVVDIGGSSGHDLPDVVRNAVAEREVSSASADRHIEFMPHDFFEQQTVTADAYLFRWVFHDWPDQHVIKILRSQVPALKPGARIIVNESVSPEPNSLPISVERTIRFIDMLMLTTNNSRLRDVEEWQDIFTTADPRFGAIRSWVPKGAALAIIEAVWEGQGSV